MPKWTKAPEALVALFERSTATIPDVEGRKMFGYPAAFIRGQMFSGLFQSSMILRLSPDDRAQFLEEFGATAFEPMPGHRPRLLEVAGDVADQVPGIRVVSSGQEATSENDGYGREEEMMPDGEGETP